IVSPHRRLVIVVADVLVEGLVLVIGDVVPGLRPQRAGLVDRLVLLGDDLLALLLVPLLLLHDDRLDDVVGILADQAAQLPARQQVFLVLTQVQRDRRTAIGLFDLLGGVFAGR